MTSPSDSPGLFHLWWFGLASSVFLGVVYNDDWYMLTAGLLLWFPIIPLVRWYRRELRERRDREKTRRQRIAEFGSEAAYWEEYHKRWDERYKSSASEVFESRNEIGKREKTIACEKCAEIAHLCRKDEFRNATYLQSVLGGSNTIQIELTQYECYACGWKKVVKRDEYLI